MGVGYIVREPRTKKKGVKGTTGPPSIGHGIAGSACCHELRDKGLVAWAVCVLSVVDP